MPFGGTRSGAELETATRQRSPRGRPTGTARLFPRSFQHARGALRLHPVWHVITSRVPFDLGSLVSTHVSTVPFKYGPLHRRAQGAAGRAHLRGVVGSRRVRGAIAAARRACPPNARARVGPRVPQALGPPAAGEVCARGDGRDEGLEVGAASATGVREQLAHERRAHLDRGEQRLGE